MYAHTYKYRKYKETLRQRERERETRIKARTSARKISNNIAEHWKMYSERKRERSTDQEKEIYT